MLFRDRPGWFIATLATKVAWMSSPVRLDFMQLSRQLLPPCQFPIWSLKANK
jgi:hypothetical protein